jgi:major vault protein
MNIGQALGAGAPRGMPIAASAAPASMSNVSYSSTTSSAESAAQALVGSGATQRKTSNTPPRTITLDTKYDGVVSVDVWTGYAALLVRKNGDRRVVVGPQTVLLEYDERPMMLELSTGTPKTDERKLKTGFLRILNNSVSDSVTVETQDSFQARVTLRYHLNFEGANPEVWFNVEDYVQFLAERTRSMIRREAKRHTVRDLRDNAIDIVRNLILGEPVVGEGHVGRPGRTFDENGMVIFDLDVETPSIQGDVDRLLRDTEQMTLRQSLERDQKERDLAHQQRMEEIDRDLQLATAETAELRGRLILQDLARALQQQLAQVNNTRCR